MCHFSTEFREDRSSSFYIILLTNKLTNADENITSLAQVNISVNNFNDNTQRIHDNMFHSLYKKNQVLPIRNVFVILTFLRELKMLPSCRVFYNLYNRSFLSYGRE